ncbi:Hypothetical_protein [Hexamita inflata]|uniref:Hypothetical_protein n=1 Tax=Hexamita inflata TaxID=28002 RepID=A0AA86USP9_9EUKA|nr:Hypothetical protein HINF_LOCUS50911 [Hexamita inflata]
MQEFVFNAVLEQTERPNVITQDFIAKANQCLDAILERKSDEQQLSVDEAKHKIKSFLNQFKSKTIQVADEQAIIDLIKSTQNVTVYYSNQNHVALTGLIVCIDLTFFTSPEQLVQTSNRTRSQHMSNYLKFVQQLSKQQKLNVICVLKSSNDIYNQLISQQNLIQTLIHIKPETNFIDVVLPLAFEFGFNAILNFVSELSEEVVEYGTVSENYFVYIPVLPCDINNIEANKITIKNQDDGAFDYAHYFNKVNFKLNYYNKTEFLQDFQVKINNLKRQKQLFPFWRFSTKLWCHRVW